MNAKLGSERRFRALAGALLGLTVLLSTTAARAQTSYRIQVLGTLGGSYSSADDVNSKKQVVGRSFRKGGFVFNGHEHGYVWENGVMKDLGALAGDYSAANAINEQGDIAGESYPIPNFARPHACVWRKGVSGNYQIQDLNSILSEADRQKWELLSADDINDFGIVGGRGSYRDPDTGVSRDLGYLLDLTSIPPTVRPIPALGQHGRVFGINNLPNPLAVGHIFGPSVPNQAFLYDGPSGVLTPLPQLDTLYGVNDFGECVGSGPVYRDPVDGELVPLGDLGAPGGAAVAINNATSRVAVGWAYTIKRGEPYSRAFRWRVGSASLEALSPLVEGGKTTLRYATAINDQGLIVGAANTRGEDISYIRAYLLTPQ